MATAHKSDQGRKTPLAKKISQFRTDSSGERNLYPLVRDMLVNPAFGIGLKTGQIVVDSKTTGGRDIRDLTVFSTKAGQPVKTPHHAYGVFEVKRGHEVVDHAAAIYAPRSNSADSGRSLIKTAAKVTGMANK